MEFILGERKKVTIRISSRKTAPFVIRNPTYSLMKGVSGKEVAAGECSLNDLDISAMVEPQETGAHLLVFSYEIGNERLKAKVPIKVEKG